MINAYKRNKNQVSFATDEDVGVVFEIIGDFKEKYVKIYDKFAEKTVRTFVNKTESNADQTVVKSIQNMNSEELKIQKNIKSPEIDATIEAIVSENLALIKNIPEEYFKKLTFAMSQAVQNGQSLTSFKQQLMKIKGMTERRAALIATDQSNKAYQAISRRKLQACGVKHFEWVYTYASKEPRIFHRDTLNGQIFEFDNPPVIDRSTGEKGFPGQLVNCKCMMRPIVNFEHK